MSIKIKLKKSLIGASKKQIAVAESLGLRRIGDTTTQPENEATKGKIHKIAHLLETKKGETNWDCTI